jgi:hypothetical protein
MNKNSSESFHCLYQIVLEYYTKAVPLACKDLLSIHERSINSIMQEHFLIAALCLAGDS